MAEMGRGDIRVIFTKEGLTPDLKEEGHPYPVVDWKIDGGTLFIKYVGIDGPKRDYIFGPKKWLSVTLLN